MLMVNVGWAADKPVELKQKEKGLWATEFEVNPFVAYRSEKLGRFDDMGAGLAAQYNFNKYVGIQAEAESFNNPADGPLVERVGASFVAKYPIKRFAPLFLIGAGYNPHSKAWDYASGGGIMFKFSRNFGAVVDTRILLNNEGGREHLSRFGMSLSF